MSIEEVRHAYNDFNHIFFNGCLPSVSKIMFIFDNKAIDNEEDVNYAGYTYVNNADGFTSPLSHKYPDQYTYVIAINGELLKTKKEILETLAHEMIHIYQFTQDFKKYSAPNTWHMQHNRVFIHKMNYINSVAPEYGYDMHLDVVYSDDK